VFLDDLGVFVECGLEVRDDHTLRADTLRLVDLRVGVDDRLVVERFEVRPPPPGRLDHVRQVELVECRQRVQPCLAEPLRLAAPL